MYTVLCLACTSKFHVVIASSNNNNKALTNWQSAKQPTRLNTFCQEIVYVVCTIAVASKFHYAIMTQYQHFKCLYYGSSNTQKLLSTECAIYRFLFTESH